MHDHSHCDHHSPANYGGAFAIGIGLNAAFVIAEVIFGIANKSLSLVADAGHNLGDVLGLGMGWAAVFLACRPATPRRTYGYRRSSILAALGNSSLLMAGVGAVAWEALQRLSEPVQVPGGVVMLVAAIGIVVNGATALLFMQGRKADLNREAAYMHMLTDAAISAGVVVAGFAMRLTSFSWIDPACGLLIAALVAVSSWGMLRRSIDLALDAVPEGIDTEAVKRFLLGLSGVEAVTDLHIWAVSTTETALTAHLVAPVGLDEGFLLKIERDLQSRFAIKHSTIQVERSQTANGCALEF